MDTLKMLTHFLCVCLGCLTLTTASSESSALTFDNPCVQQTLCTCETETGIIDLTPLADHKNLVAIDGMMDQIFFNPCKTFKRGKECNDVLMCEETTVEKRTTLATKDHATFRMDKEKLSLHYTTKQAISIVDLVCDEAAKESKFQWSRTTSAKTPTYYFSLTSKLSCEQSNSTASPPTSISSSPTKSSTRTSTGKPTGTTTKPTGSGTTVSGPTRTGSTGSGPTKSGPTTMPTTHSTPGSSGAIRCSLVAMVTLFWLGRQFLA